MSELMNMQAKRAQLRWQLLSTASSAVLLLSAIVANQAMAGDEDRPTVWIELGGQLERMSGLGNPFEPAFTLVTPTPKPYIDGSPIDAQRPSRYSIGGEGKLMFEPDGSDWVFSAQVRYGRSHNNRSVFQQTNYDRTTYHSGNPAADHPSPYISRLPPAAQFANTIVKQSQSHAVMDFMAGKDVGLGMFGRGSSSVFSAGVRYAQFSSTSHITARAAPHVSVYNEIPPTILVTSPKWYIPGSRYLQYSAFATAVRSFHGIGPSLSWNASVPMIGSEQAGEVSFDWGLNGALLFGRQKATTSHQTTTHFHTKKYQPTPTVAHPRVNNIRSHSATVPNVGVSAAVSYRVVNFKATLGYRTDFFFGAVDAGIDVRRTTDLTFHGPFLNFSLGL